MTQAIRDALAYLRRRGSDWTTREIAEEACPPVSGCGIRCPEGSPQHRAAAGALLLLARRGEVEAQGEGHWRIL